MITFLPPQEKISVTLLRYSNGILEILTVILPSQAEIFVMANLRNHTYSPNEMEIIVNGWNF